MIPVDQTIFEPPSGNCMAACVASIMERPLWTVPNFVMVFALHPDGWYRKFTEWVVGQGWGIVSINEELQATGNFGLQVPDGSLCIATGYSPRSGQFPDLPVLRHCVVADANTNEVVHDPHPSREGLDPGPVTWEFLWRAT